jgi:hypothetical protein
MNDDNIVCFPENAGQSESAKDFGAVLDGMAEEGLIQRIPDDQRLLRAIAQMLSIALFAAALFGTHASVGEGLIVVVVAILLAAIAIDRRVADYRNAGAAR